jgi:DNA polymerase elongation subunit (family B)
VRGVRINTRELRVLDFDCECRPLAWYGGDFVTKQPTAIAWKFIGERGRIQSAVIGESGLAANVEDEEAIMLESFREAFDAADVVTGHFIRGFDLPLLNGALIRLGLPLLSPKLSQDTKSDFKRRHGISMSQENLGAMFELEHPKVQMDTTLWGRGNMLLPEYIETVRKRAVGDVKQHIALRQRMLELGVLGPPSRWSPTPSGRGSYVA